MIVAEKYKHRPHPLEVVEVTLDNYLEVAVYIGAENSQLHRKTSGEASWVSFEFKPGTTRGDDSFSSPQGNVALPLPGKITIKPNKLVQVLDEEFLKKNYKKA